MKLLEVLVEYSARSLDRPFSYFYRGEKPIGPRFRVRCAFNKKSLIGFVVSSRDYQGTPEELSTELGYRVNEIHDEDIVDEEPLLTSSLMDLAKEVASYYMAPLISVLQAMLPPSLAPRSSSLKAPKIAYETYVEAISKNEEGLTLKQIEALRFLVSSSPLRKKEAGSPSILEALAKKGRVRFFKKERRRLEIPEREREVPHEMTYEQREAYDKIIASEKPVILLEGVTGSGKTEVYLRLSEHCLENGKKVLMLVPEINLTPAMVDYFARRFGSKIAILHSELTPGERYDEYRRIARGEADIVVGARSAVFAPLENIGLIILDEEHVDSYKQDNAPHYHAREVAIMRGKAGAKVVLGSATPSLETRARALKGVYGYASMPHRVNERPLPLTTIVDLRERGTMGNESNKLSKYLIAKIREKLSKKEQCLLLINRRGYWSGINCPRCGHLFKCPECGSNLVYHFRERLLKCHHCGHVELYPDACPECGSHELRRVNYGTERLEEEVTTLFPTARVARLDSDTARSASKLEKLVHAFREKEFDILVGTQIVAKGHDFPFLTLAAVTDADIGLALPGYRSAERSFELIAQAVGRAGRSTLPGEAIIQTYNPNHYAIVMGAKQDYPGFFLREMRERKIAQFPPYVLLVAVEFGAANEEKAQEEALSFANELRTLELEKAKVIGPLTPYFVRKDGYFRRVVVLKFKKREAVEGPLKELIARHGAVPGIRIDVDVDPLDY